MKESKYTEVKATAENGRQLVLAYYVLAEDCADELRHYGVKIIERNTGEMAQITDLTTEASTAYRLVDKLAKNTVTPSSLMDIISDWL